MKRPVFFVLGSLEEDPVAAHLVRVVALALQVALDELVRAGHVDGGVRHQPYEERLRVTRKVRAHALRQAHQVHCVVGV